MGKKINIIIVAVLICAGTTAGIFSFQNRIIGNAPVESHPQNTQQAAAVDYDDAETKAFKAELAINPNNPDALRGLAQSLWTKLANYEEGPSNLVLDLLDTLLKLQSIDPQDKLTLLMLANLSFNQRVFDKSAQYYEKYLILEPEDTEARANYSSVLTFIGKLDDALRQIDIVVGKDPKSFQANAYRAITLAQMGRVDEAKKVGESAMQYAPSEEAKNRFGKFLASLDNQQNSPQQQNEPDNNEPSIVKVVKQSSVAGPKLVSSKAEGKFLLLTFKDFPMKSMPPIAKDIFFSKIRAANQQDKFEEIKFIDAASGTLMESLSLKD